MPTRRGGKKKKKSAEDDDSRAPSISQGPADDFDMYQEPVKKLVTPAEQLTLTEEELAEDHTRVLTANDPNEPNNITKYNYKDRCYKVREV